MTICLYMIREKTWNGGFDNESVPYPKYKAALVQAVPVFLNRDATIEKACILISEAVKNRGRLVAFPELFVPRYALDQ